MKRTVFTLVAVVALAIAASSGHSQIPPNLPAENHYLVYETSYQLGLPPVGPLTLRDQWGQIVYDGQLWLSKWGNPLFFKNGEDVSYDPRVHLSWYTLETVATARHEILVGHQFGSYNYTVENAIFLLNPADKDFAIPPPDEWPRWANHYLCYMIAGGEPVQFPLDMDDQWGRHTNVAYEPYCFCNPVEKTLPTGESFPIMDPEAHLTCYRLNPNPADFPFYFDDQFASEYLSAFSECLICLPSTKDEVLPSEETNWGRIKALFGDQ